MPSPLIREQRDDVTAVQPDQEVGSAVQFLVDRQPAEPEPKRENVELGAVRHTAWRALRAPQVEQVGDGDSRMEFFHGLSGRVR